MDFVMSLELEEGMDLIEYVFEQVGDEMIFQRWVHDLHLHMSFEEFKQKLKPQPMRDEAEILGEVKDILAMVKR